MFFAYTQPPPPVAKRFPPRSPQFAAPGSVALRRVSPKVFQKKNHLVLELFGAPVPNLNPQKLGFWTTKYTVYPNINIYIYIYICLFPNV